MADILTGMQIIDGLKKAGWTDAEIPTAYAIIQAESSGDRKALNPNSTATGLMQIMYSVWVKDPDVRKAVTGDPDKTFDRNMLQFAVPNLKAGLVVRRKQGWTAWEVYNKKTHEPFLLAGKNNLAKYNENGPGENGDVLGTTPLEDGKDLVQDAVKDLDPGGWKATVANLTASAGVLILALVLIILGVVLIARQSATKIVGKTIGTALGKGK